MFKETSNNAANSNTNPLYQTKIKFPLKNQGEFSLTLKTTNMKSVEII